MCSLGWILKDTDSSHYTIFSLLNMKTQILYTMRLDYYYYHIFLTLSIYKREME